MRQCLPFYRTVDSEQPCAHFRRATRRRGRVVHTARGLLPPQTVSKHSSFLDGASKWPLHSICRHLFFSFFPLSTFWVSTCSNSQGNKTKLLHIHWFNAWDCRGLWKGMCPKCCIVVTKGMGLLLQCVYVSCHAELKRSDGRLSNRHSFESIGSSNKAHH